mmetsp:Transcript_39847/g.90382  ORF Transcript_39847/g.90382 Transcript_39847/m.90382 type:complete len:697 (-) Transcript_39847:88-2178(-)
MSHATRIYFQRQRGHFPENRIAGVRRMAFAAKCHLNLFGMASRRRGWGTGLSRTSQRYFRCAFCSPFFSSPTRFINPRGERAHQGRILLEKRLLAALLVVGGDAVRGGDAGAVRVDVGRHVVGVGQHVLAQLVEARGGDQVARAVDLPGDGRIARAFLVVARGAGGRARVLGHVGALVGRGIDDHALEEVGVVVRLIVDDGESLRLDADLLVRVERSDRDDAVVAEHTIVEGRLHLPLRAARAGSRVRPVDLVRLAHHHVGAALPGVRVGELGISRVVVVAPVAQARVRTRQLATGARVTTVGRAAVDGALAVPVELSHGEVLGAEVPVDVDRAKVGLVVRGGDGHAVTRIKQALVAPGHVGAGLLEHLNDVVLHAVHVREVVVARARIFGLLPLARVDGRVDGGRVIEGTVRGHHDDDGERADCQTSGGTADHLHDELPERFRRGMLVGLVVRGRGAEDCGHEDERRRDVADDGKSESVRIVEVLGDDDRWDDLVLAFPCGVEDTDGEENDGQESHGENQPHERCERLGNLGGKKAGERKRVEEDHQNSHGLCDEAERHGRHAGSLELVALQERHRVLQGVARDHAGECSGDHREAKVLDELRERGFRAIVVPRAARLVMVQTDAVRLTQELVETVVKTDRFQARVGHNREILNTFQHNHRVSVGHDGCNGERDDSRYKACENVMQLGVNRRIDG